MMGGDATNQLPVNQESGRQVPAPSAGIPDSTSGTNAADCHLTLAAAGQLVFSDGHPVSRIGWRTIGRSHSAAIHVYRIPAPGTVECHHDRPLPARHRTVHPGTRILGLADFQQSQQTPMGPREYLEIPRPSTHRTLRQRRRGYRYAAPAPRTRATGDPKDRAAAMTFSDSEVTFGNTSW